MNNKCANIHSAISHRAFKSARCVRDYKLSFPPQIIYIQSILYHTAHRICRSVTVHWSSILRGAQSGWNEKLRYDMRMERHKTIFQRL